MTVRSVRFALPARARLRTPIVAGGVIAALIATLFVAAPSYAADTTAPGKPGSVTATYYGGIGTVMSWGKVSASDLKGYRLYRSTSSSISTSSTLIQDSAALTATDATAVPGTKYYYAVLSYDTSGNASGLSSSKTVTASDTTKPANPSSLKATASTAGIALDWKDNSELDLAGYTVSRATTSSGPWTVLASAVTNSAFNDTAAPTAVKSYYRVTASDRAGNTSSYASANATRTGTAPAPVTPTAPTAPTGFAATLSTANVPLLTWTAATGASSYTLARSTSATGPFTTVASGITATTYTDGAAPARTTVYYSLSAVNTAGASTAATTSIAVPGDTTLPGRPGSAKATVVPGAGMTITWGRASDADLAGYLVLKRTDGKYVPFLGSAESPYALLTLTDATLVEGSTHYFRIFSVDTSGNVSKVYTAVTANNPNVKPGAPSSLKVTQDATAGLALSWKAPTDVDLAGYTIYRSTASSSGYAILDNVTTEAAGASPTFRDTSAPKGTTVYYRVVAVDAVGNLSSNSSTVSGTSQTTPIPLVYTENVLTVGPDKQFATIAAAVAAVPRNNIQRYRIDIDPGTYNEVVRIRSAFVTLNGTGTNPADTVIASAQASGSPDPADASATLGTAGSYVLYVDSNATDVTLRNITVANTFDEAAHPEITSQQAVALRVEGDRFVADHVRLIGNQDTLLADTIRPTARVRQYYVDSYIEGDVDYVFGAASAVFDRVTFRSLDRSKANNGYLTAASTDKGSKYGFLIWDSKIVSSAAAGTVNLGRPWHPSADAAAQGSVTIMHTWLPAAIDTVAPWDAMSTRNSSGTLVAFDWTTGRFSEFDNVGPGASVNDMRPQLAEKDAAKISPAAQLAGSDGWNPVIAAVAAAPASPTGLTASTDIRLVNLAWNDDESAATVGWNVYRADAEGSFTLVGTTDRASFADTTVSTGSEYRYLVTALTREDIESSPSAEIAVTVAAAEHAVDFVVDPSATPSATTFPTITAALNAAPAGTAVDPTVIAVAAGRYSEYLTLAKPYTILRGATGSASDVVITGNHAAGTPTGETIDGVAQTYGTSGSATMAITANNDKLENLTVENAYVEGTYTNGQAVALRTAGDRITLDGVRLLGNQDTFYANSASRTAVARVYVHDSYLEGDVDFIFGRATVVVDRSTLHITDHGTSPNGSVTAASTSAANPFGILITNSRIIGDAPNGSQNLGRPWQPGISQADGTSVRDEDAIAQVVVRDTWLGPVVSQTAWTDMVNSGFTTTWQSARFAEYRNSGPGANPTSASRAQLDDTAATGYTAETYLAGADGWNPVAEPVVDEVPTAPVGVTATGADRSIALDWPDAAAYDVVSYRVYGSDTPDVPVDDAHVVAEVTASHYTETLKANGTTRYYRVVAIDLAGQASAASDEVSATSTVPPLVADLTVAADGSGDYTTVQAALAAAPAGTSAHPTVIVVEPGIYREVVNSTKANLVIVGSTGDAHDVTIVFGNANGTAASVSTCPFVTTAATCGTGGSATVTLTGAGVQVRDITISNDFSRAANPTIVNTQAVALRATGDRQVYSGVRLLGHQDTLNADANGNITADGSGYPRQYYVDSYIEGDVDFVFGRAAAVFDRVTFQALARSGGTIFAPSTAAKSKGYLVVDSRFASDNDPGTFSLGRPWPAWSDGAYADNSRGQVWIVDSFFAAGFNTTHPWTDMAPLVWSDGRFGEYGSTGPGVAASADRPQLTAVQAQAATASAWLAGTDGWNPAFDGSATAPAAPTALTAVSSAGKVALDWAENTEADVRGYRVYRDGVLVGSTAGSAYSDTGVVNGTSYVYVVSAVDAAGHESAASAEVTATPSVHFDARVAADGSGDYTTLAAALAAAQSGWTIAVSPGTYVGTVTANVPVTIIGTGAAAADTVLTSTGSTATLSIPSANVTVSHLTLENAATSGNAPALSMTGDRIVVSDSVLRSSGNRTVFADTSTYTAAARQLITGSTVIGGSDIFLGRATLVINGSTIAPRQSGTILTPSTAADQKGFLLINSTVTTDGVTNVQLGRPYRAWADTYTPRSVGQSIVRDTVLGAGLATSQPWGVGPAGEAWTLGRFAEYANTGAGAGTGANRPQLSAIDSQAVSVDQWLGAPTWYPEIADPQTPSDVTAPDAVTGLSVTPTDAAAALSWTASASSDVAAYRVYRAAGSSVTPSPTTLVGTVGAGATSFNDSGLTNATAYAWAVVAVDTSLNTSTSAVTSGTPMDSVPPSVPTGVNVIAADSKATLNWTAVIAADLAGYRVYRDGVQVADLGVDARSFLDTGLTNGAVYSYTVTAYDTTALESAASTVVTAKPSEGDAIAPAAPSAVKTVLGRGSVTVTWQAPADDDVASYTVYRNGVSAATVAAGSTAWTDSTVVIGTAYTYAVRATDASANDSVLSAAATATPIAVNYVVAADGSGDYTSLQQILGTPAADGSYDAANPGVLANNADYSAQGYRTILVKPGTYTGPLVSGNRYGVRIVGATGDASDVVLTAPGGAIPVFSVSGAQWTFRDITLKSVAASAGAQATALQIRSGDKQLVEHVRLLGDKQLLLVSTANATTFSRVLVRDSYLEGGADLMLGRAVVVVQRSEIHVLNRPGASITDSSISSANAYGFLITDSTITAEGAAGTLYLGRPYPENAATQSQVVVRDSVLPAAIVTAKPWNDWSATVLWTAARFSEYHNTGDGAGTGANRPQLDDSTQAQYTVNTYLGDWTP